MSGTPIISEELERQISLADSDAHKELGMEDETIRAFSRETMREIKDRMEPLRQKANDNLLGHSHLHYKRECFDEDAWLAGFWWGAHKMYFLILKELSK